MSDRYRKNIISSGKGSLNTRIPKLVNDSKAESPRKKIIDKLFHNQRYSANDNYNPRPNGFSCISSAQSQRFNDIFYRNDWPSLSDTETCDSPDYLESEGSDSSASSMFSWADIEGTRRVSEEWEKIQRTLYDEDGPKVTQPHLIEECQQWKTIFPHLRVVGRTFTLTDPNYESPHETEEVLALNYDSDDYNTSNMGYVQSTRERPVSKKLIDDSQIKTQFRAHTNKTDGINLIENLNTILHISPVCYNLPVNRKTRKNKTPDIFKSEKSSSKWRQRNSDSPVFASLPYQSVNNTVGSTRESSASSLFDTNNFNSFSRNIWSGVNNTNIAADKHKFNTERVYLLEPIEMKKNVLELNKDMSNVRSGTARNRNIALPPIYSNESKTKRNVALNSGNSSSGKVLKQNKKILSPLDTTSAIVPKHNIKIDVDALSLFENRSAVSKYKKKKGK